MTAFDYGTLTGAKSTPGSIRSWVNYELVDVEGALLDAQSYIYGALRAREMRASATVTISSAAVTAALPTGFLDPILFQHNDTGERIDPLTSEMLLSIRARDGSGNVFSGKPGAYSIWDELLQFDAKADATYSATLLFYQRPIYLGASNATNFLTTRYPSVLRAACLMAAADMMDDTEEYARFAQRADQLIARANVENDLVHRGVVHQPRVF